MTTKFSFTKQTNKPVKYEMVEEEVEFTLPIYLNRDFIEQSVFRMDEDFNWVEISLEGDDIDCVWFGDCLDKEDAWEKISEYSGCCSKEEFDHWKDKVKELL